MSMAPGTYASAGSTSSRDDARKGNIANPRANISGQDAQRWCSGC